MAVKIMRLVVAIELPTDPWAEAEQKMKIKPLWDALIEGLKAADIVAHEREGRAKRSDIGKPRARKPRSDGNRRDFALAPVPPPQDAA